MSEQQVPQQTRRRQPSEERGFALIGTYMVLSFFLVYSQVMTMRTMTERVAQDQYRAEAQALDLAQAAVEQFKSDFYAFQSDLYGPDNTLLIPIGLTCDSNAVCVYDWLDSLGQALRGDPDDPLYSLEDPPLLLPGAANPTGKEGDPLCLDNTLPTIPRLDSQGAPVQCLSQAESDAPGAPSAWLPRAWITNVCVVPSYIGEDGARVPPGQQVIDNDPEGSADYCLPDDKARYSFAPRRITVQAQAQVGSVTKTIQAQYDVGMRGSRIFNNAYFLNNQGWFTVKEWATSMIYGDVRANGDLRFYDDSNYYIAVSGDLYAAENDDTTPASEGIIDIIDTARDNSPYHLSDAIAYLKSKPLTARPLRDLVLDGQPKIQGGNTRLSTGWDLLQTPHDHATSKGMPYLGNLQIYNNLAVQSGSSLKAPASPGRRPWKVQHGVYLGQDGKRNNPNDLDNDDDDEPLVLIGTRTDPIIIDGPVVVPGDVIIRGTIAGQGVIYAGRNIHVIGELKYQTRPAWPSLDRNRNTGQLRQSAQCSDDPGVNLGFVCVADGATEGTYVPPGGRGCPP